MLLEIARVHWIQSRIARITYSNELHGQSSPSKALSYTAGWHSPIFIKPKFHYRASVLHWVNFMRSDPPFVIFFVISASFNILPSCLGIPWNLFLSGYPPFVSHVRQPLPLWFDLHNIWWRVSQIMKLPIVQFVRPSDNCSLVSK